MTTNNIKGNKNGTHLVLVESPAKAKTIAHFLGKSYIVKASKGHVRDLPARVDYWKGDLGVDVKNDFKPTYEITEGKGALIKEIKAAAKGVDSVYLATDPDREGEAIAWHLQEAAGLKKIPVRRVVFHEITEEAIKVSFSHPRDIDMELVNAQQARRVLDRLGGYRLSPLLWRKVRKGLSSGRVQSVAVRIVVKREREIEGFVPQEYWTLDVDLAQQVPKTGAFRARLEAKTGVDKLKLNNESETGAAVADLQGANYAVAKVEQRQVQRRPAAPFITSTLQQEASRKLRFSANRTMSIAQRLYEGLPLGPEGEVGLITYMRTDSPHLAKTAVDETRAYIHKTYGESYLPHTPRAYASKSKTAQEAHEAIRPTAIHRTPEAVKAYLDPDQYQLYELIWKRMLACQMANAVYDSTSIVIDAHATGKPTYHFKATGSVQRFPGFMAVYQESTEDQPDEDGKQPLPTLVKGEALDCRQLLPDQHFTEPPPRYTEASLIKALEDNGIGRPSTYAPTLSTIQQRGYIEKEKGRFKPRELGSIVTKFLEEHFSRIVDIGFTAEMEEELDDIARGERDWVRVLREFYTPFDKQVNDAVAHAPNMKPAVEKTDVVCDKCGSPMVIRESRFGKFIGCTGFPKCKNIKRIVVKVGVCPQCGGDVAEKRARKGKTFYGCNNYPTCNFVLNRKPLPDPCPECGSILIPTGRDSFKCVKCTYSGELDPETGRERAPAGEAAKEPALAEA